MDDARTGKHIANFGRLQERKQWGFDTVVSLGRNDSNFDCIPRLRRFSIYLELYIQSLFQLSWTVHPLFSLQMEKRATQRQ